MAAEVPGCDRVSEGTWLWRSPAVVPPQNKTPSDNQEVTSLAGGGQDAGYPRCKPTVQRQDGPRYKPIVQRVVAAVHVPSSFSLYLCV